MNEYELAQQFDEFLDEVYGTVKIAGYEYNTSQALKEVDPIAYSVGMNDYESSLEESEQMNRLLTTLVQLALLAVTIPMVVMVIKDIKNGGLK